MSESRYPEIHLQSSHVDISLSCKLMLSFHLLWGLPIRIFPKKVIIYSLLIYRPVFLHFIVYSVYKSNKYTNLFKTYNTLQLIISVKYLFTHPTFVICIFSVLSQCRVTGTRREAACRAAGLPERPIYVILLRSSSSGTHRFTF